MAFAPGAFAATLSVDTGVLTYTGGTGATSAVEFDETDVGTVVVHKVESGRDMDLGPQNFGTWTDNDAITIGAGCDDDVDGTPGADTDANGDPIITCTGVTVGVVANPGDENDAIDASGTLSDDGPGLVTLPLTSDLGTGNDVALGGKGNDIIHGNDGDDFIGGDLGGPGGGSQDQLFGDAGADGIAGGSGQDLVDGGADDDEALIGGPGPDTINGGDGNDGFIQGGPGPDTIDGGAGNDSIGGDCFGDPCPIGSEGADTINGGAGDDQINGEGAGDTINGGDGSDDITGGAGADTIHGNAGNDDIEGDICCGGASPGNDTLFGDEGDDDVRGQGGDDTADGGAGDDYVAGGQGTDNVSGGDGDDYVQGAAGNDTVSGGAGDDYLTGDCGGYQNCGDSTDGNDTVDAGSGEDYVDADGGTDVQNGGSGIDHIEYEDRYYDCSQPGPCVQVSHPVSITFDGVANDGGAGENDTVNGFEDAGVHDGGCCGTTAPEGGATIVGDAGVNSLSGGNAADTVNGGDGNDFLYGNGGDDTMNANDGFADRVTCGSGTDVANVDEFDQVADDCETVNRTTRGGLASEDAPPTVTWVSPASGAKMSTSKANTLTVNATDDHGISQVIFLAGERVVCTDTAAPYTCDYKPTGDEVGKVTLTAVAVDTRQQQGSALRTVKVGRFTPRKVSAKTTPKKDASLPFTFTTTGTVSLPTGVTKAVGCAGKVSVTFKSGKKTISTHRTSLKKTCSFRSKVTFRLPSRLHPKSLQVVVRYQGNAVLTAKSAKRYSVKTA